MSSSSTVLEDDSLLSRFDRLFFKLESLLNLIGGLVIFLIVLLAVANILGRKLFDLPVNGYIDWTEQAMAFFAFFGIAYCQRLGGHIRMDIFVGSMRGRALWFFELMSTILMFAVTVVLVIGSYGHFLRAWTNGDSSFDIDLPTWPAKLVVPVMLSILSIRLFLNIWGYIRALIVGGDSPVAVPLIEDAATQAAHEAETVSGAEVDGELK
jgi:TRAP-type C4-dicarboxylate transport system permease small subunit